MEQKETIPEYLERAEILLNDADVIEVTVPEELFITILLAGLSPEWIQMRSTIQAFPEKQKTRDFIFNTFINEHQTRELAKAKEENNKPAWSAAVSTQGYGNSNNNNNYNNNNKGKNQRQASKSSNPSLLGRYPSSSSSSNQHFSSNPSQPAKPQSGKFNFTCHYCHQWGHPWFKCPRKPPNWTPPPHLLTAKGRAALSYAGISFAMTSSAPTSTFDPDFWYLDSGCDQHMTPNPSLLHSLTTTGVKSVTVANKESTPTAGEGILTFLNPTGKPVSISGVLLVPNLGANLLSVGQLEEKDCIFSFESGTVQIRYQGLLIARGERVGRLYRLKLDVNPEYRRLHGYTAAASTTIKPHPGTATTPYIWHCRLGHPGASTTKSITAHASLEGLHITSSPESSSSLSPCPSCVEAKHAHHPHPPVNIQVSSPLDLVHSDIIGPTRTLSRTGKRFIMTLIDHKTRFAWVFLLESKDLVPEAFKVWHEHIKNTTGLQVKTLHSDRGGEYMSKSFRNHLSSIGIAQEFSCPYTPQQNGIAERFNRTLQEIARSLLLHMKLDDAWWGEAVNHAVHLKNRRPTIALPSGITPFEAWHGKKPDVSMLRVFGCMAQYRIPDEKRGKFESKTRWAVHIGLSKESKGWILWDPLLTKEIVSRDVIFHEDMSLARWKLNYLPPSPSLEDPLPTPPGLTTTPAVEPSPSAPAGDTTASPPVPENNTSPHEQQQSQSEPNHTSPPLFTHEPSSLQPSMEQPLSRESTPEQHPTAEKLSSTVPSTSSPPVNTSTIIPDAADKPPQLVQPPNDVPETTTPSAPPPIPDGNTSHEGITEHRQRPRRARKPVQRMNLAVGASFPVTAKCTNPHCMDCKVVAMCHAISCLPPEPSTRKQALASAERAEWVKAEREEINSLLTQGTWVLAPLPPGKRALKVKWTYRVKVKGDGTLDRFKARLVAKGASW
ncbi:unnamed protein product [Closterium sp. NIES-53]